MTLSTQGKYRERIKSLFPMQGNLISISCRLNPKVLFFTTRESFTEHNRRSMFWYARKKGNRDEIQSSSLNPFISSSSGVGKSVKSTPFPTQGNIITGPQEQHYTDVRTNTVNRRTMFASWHLHYDLNGANGLENEGCVASWELYP